MTYPERVSFFSLQQFRILIASPPIAVLLMAQNPYLPSVVSSTIIALCIALLQTLRSSKPALTTALDETRRSTERLLNESDQGHTRTPGNAALSNDSVNVRSEVPTDTASELNESATKALVSFSLHHLKQTVVGSRHELILGFCYLGFYLKSVAMANEAFVFQYLSERFNWLLRETTILHFALSFGAVLSTLVIGPLVSSRLTHRGLPTRTIDLGIISASLAVLTVCFIIAWQTESSTISILCMWAYCNFHGSMISNSI